MEIGAALSVLIPLIAALFKFWLDRAPERKEKAENEKIQQGRQDIADGNVAAVSERIDSLPQTSSNTPRLGNDENTKRRLAEITGG